jgi:hypothetical protein
MPFGFGPGGWFGYPYVFPFWWRVYPGYYPYEVAAPYWSPYAAISKEQEIPMLKDQERALTEQLEAIRKRIGELEKE